MAIVVAKNSTARSELSWQPFDEVGGGSNRGARLAVDIADDKATFLFVDIEANGSIAMHSQPERAVCYIVEGSGTVIVEGQPDLPYAQADVIKFEPNVAHGWRGRDAPTRILVVVLP